MSSQDSQMHSKMTHLNVREKARSPSQLKRKLSRMSKEIKINFLLRIFLRWRHSLLWLEIIQGIIKLGRRIDTKDTDNHQAVKGYDASIKQLNVRLAFCDGIFQIYIIFCHVNLWLFWQHPVWCDPALSLQLSSCLIAWLFTSPQHGPLSHHVQTQCFLAPGNKEVLKKISLIPEGIVTTGRSTWESDHIHSELKATFEKSAFSPF